ncbi:MAG: hypothetical protein ACJ8DT_11720 [Microvirga sp.]
MLGALRRLVLLVVLCSALTLVASVLLGLLVDAELDRAISLGFYGLGCFLMVSGFFVGNRGPARVKSEAAGWTMIPLPGLGSRRLRWATREEQHETINNSAVFILLGVILVVIGVLVDSQHSLV